MKPRVIVACLILVVFGAIKVHFEAALQTERSASHFNSAKFSLTLRQQVGQMSFLAAVGGFRALVADYCYLDAHAQWSRVEWGRMKLNFDAATALQPRCILFWEQAAWHMAYNASVYAFEDKKDQPREALRIKAQREFWKIGVDYLQRGIANNPDEPRLYYVLGQIYSDKLQDHCSAADVYALGAKIPTAPVFVHRFAAYELAQCPGHEREAYEQLRALYLKGEDEQLPTLLKWLGNLQEKLNIPQDQRIKLPPASNP